MARKSRLHIPGGMYHAVGIKEGLGLEMLQTLEAQAPQLFIVRPHTENMYSL